MVTLVTPQNVEGLCTKDQLADPKFGLHIPNTSRSLVPKAAKGMVFGRVWFLEPETSNLGYLDILV